jgi:hypothetical protein
MPKPLYVVAGQSNAGWIAKYGAVESYIQDNNLNATVINSYQPGKSIAPSQDRPDFYPFESNDPNVGELMDQMILDIQNTLANDPDTYLAGVLWVQGEADRREGIADDYEQNLQGVYDQLTLNFGGGFNFSVSQLSENMPAHSSPHRKEFTDIIQNAQQAFTDKNDMAVLIDPDDVFASHDKSIDEVRKDVVHYNKDGATYIADAFMDQFYGASGTVPPPPIVRIDKGDKARWDTKAIYKDADGNRTYVITEFDKGFTVHRDLENGKLTKKTVLDEADVFDFRKKFIEYDDLGRVEEIMIIHDNTGNGPGKVTHKEFTYETDRDKEGETTVTVGTEDDFLFL